MDFIAEKIQNLSSIRQGFVSLISEIWDFLTVVWNGILDLFSFLVSILWFLFYAWKTLLVWVYNLFIWILEWDVFLNVSETFLDLSDYIGIWAYFIYALMFIIIIRIIIAFVFKLMRLNIDYNSLDKNTRKANHWANSSEYHKNVNTRV